MTLSSAKAVFAAMTLCFATNSFAGEDRTAGATALEHTASFYQMAPIAGTAPGNFGNVRLYFDEACNQEFVDVLSEAIDSKSFEVGLLTRIRTSNCTRPPRRVFVTVRPRGATMVPVTAFDEVWRCQITCTTLNGEVPQTTTNWSYGTSQSQALEQLYCNGFQSSPACIQLDVVEPE
ncbi:MAG: hypothetical protein RIQ81_1394 [Pseudomonadota bacterium]|jgi:hypothetical protein